MTARRPEWVTVEENVRAGLDWLTTPGQPENAVMSQFGEQTHCGGFLTVQCSAGGWHGNYGPGRGVVVFDVTHGDTAMYGPQPEPFTRAEIDYLRGLIEAHPGVTVLDDWNGVDDDRGLRFSTYSVGISGLPADGPMRAYQNYGQGCPVHGTVFCGERAKWGDPDRDDDVTRCTWHSDGSAALIPPTWVVTPYPAPLPAPAPSDNDRNLRAVLEALERIRPVLAEVGYHPDTIVAGRRGDILEHSDGTLSFDTKDGHGVCLPAEAIVQIVQLLDGIGAL